MLLTVVIHEEIGLEIFIGCFMAGRAILHSNKEVQLSFLGTLYPSFLSRAALATPEQ